MSDIKNSDFQKIYFEDKFKEFEDEGGKKVDNDHIKSSTSAQPITVTVLQHVKLSKFVIYQINQQKCLI